MADPKALRLFLDVVSDAIVVVDRSGRVHHANVAARELLDCRPGMPLSELQPLLGDAVVEAVLQTLSRGVPRLRAPRPELPSRVVLPDGRACDLAFVPFEGERWALRLAVVGTERPTAERAGPPAELAGLFWNSPFPMLVQGSDHRITHVNPAFSEFAGLPADRLVGIDPLELQPPEDREAHRALRAQRQRGDEGQPGERPVERRIVDGAGRERWFRAVRRTLTDAGGERRHVSVLQDCTAEHVAHERADRSLRELDDWFDLSPVAMVLFDGEGLVVRTNPAFEALAGRVPVMMSDASPEVQRLLAWQDGRPAEVLRPGAGAVESVAWVSQPDGSVARLQAVLRCYESGNGQRRYMAVVEDRSAEEARDLAQVQIGALMDTAGVGLATFDEASGWVQHGSTFGAATAVREGPASAALQSIRREVVLPESLPEYERLQQALRNAERAEVRYAIRHAELGQRWLLTRVEPARLASGKQTLSVVTLDITDQYASQQRNELLLREMNTILESATVGIAYLRGNMLVRCNRRFEALLGLGAGEAIGTGLQNLFARQEGAALLVADIERGVAERGAYECELPVDLPGRPGQWCGLTVRRVGGSDAAPEVVAALNDITRLKAQQIELEALARDRELMFSVSEVGIAFVRGDRILRANEALSRLTGHEPAQLGLAPLEELFANLHEYRRLRALSQQALADDGRWSGEHPLRRRDGTLVWVQASQRLVVDGDPSGGFIASYVNVDDRHRAQQAVALQAERTRAILDSVLVGIVTVGPTGIEWMNRSARRMFGGDLADFVNQPISTVASAEPDHPFRRSQYLHELVEGQAETFECRLKAKDGREFWVVGNAVVTGRESSGRQLTYALLDIERRRQAEARTAQAQSSLQRIIETAPLAITLFDARSLRILEVNEVAARCAELVPGQMVGRTPGEIFPPEVASAREADMRDALVSMHVTQREYRVTTLGEVRLWDARYLPLATPGETPDQLLLVATDVTEQRAAQEARLEAAIAQREMLVKEVHHRIKNNLQGVAGLLQQIGARKPEMAEAMSEVVGQVQAIAQVYGLQVGMAGPLRLRSVLEAITGSVQRTFGRVIELSVEGAEPDVWGLPEAESIPIALCLNELLTNAIKHSAPEEEGGAAAAVHCRLSCREAGVEIEVANRGSLPEGFNLARYPGGVSGLGLIRALLPRRSASLRLEPRDNQVIATVSLLPPGVMRLAPV